MLAQIAAKMCPYNSPISSCLGGTATRRCSHRLFDLLILGPELLGLVDPLTLVFWKRLQVQLQTHRLVHATTSQGREEVINMQTL